MLKKNDSKQYLITAFEQRYPQGYHSSISTERSGLRFKTGEKCDDVGEASQPLITLSSVAWKQEY